MTDQNLEVSVTSTPIEPNDRGIPLSENTDERLERVAFEVMAGDEKPVALPKDVKKKKIKPRSFLQLVQYPEANIMVMETYNTIKGRMRTNELHVELTMSDGKKQSFNKSQILMFGVLPE